MVEEAAIITEILSGRAQTPPQVEVTLKPVPREMPCGAAPPIFIASPNVTLSPHPSLQLYPGAPQPPTCIQHYTVRLSLQFQLF